MSEGKREHEEDEATNKRAVVESANNAISLSHVQVIDILQWLPEEKAQQLDTWIKIDEEWKVEKVPAMETVKTVIRGIIFNWEIVSQYQLTLDSSPSAWKDFTWDHAASTIMTWPSASIKVWLKNSLSKFLQGTNRDDQIASCSSANTMNTFTSSIHARTPTGHADAPTFGTGSQSRMSFVEQLRLDASAANSQAQTGTMSCSISAVTDGTEYCTRWTAPIGDFSLDMTVYLRRDILTRNQDTWWKVRDYRVQIPYSTGSQIHYHVEKLRDLIHMSLPPTDQRETKSKARSVR